MRRIIFAGVFALSASTSLAQTSTPPETTAPAPERPAPGMTAPADPATAATGGPANLCQELAAFMKAPPPEDAPAAAAKPAEAPAKPAEQEAASTGQEAPDQEDASALAGTTQAGDAASVKPEDGTNSAQEVTGQEGVATDAPEPTDEQAAAGSVANAPQKESRPAPMPPADVSSTPKDSVMTVEEAEQLAAANDIAACQDMARQMRVAGVSMPPPLIALAALDLQYHQAGAASPQAPQAQEPAPQPQDPAAQPQDPGAQPEQ